MLLTQAWDSPLNLLISALKDSFCGAVEGLEQLRRLKMGEVTSMIPMIPAVLQGLGPSHQKVSHTQVRHCSR